MEIEYDIQSIDETCLNDGWNLILYNDSVHDFASAILALQMIKLSILDAYEFAYHITLYGYCVVWSGDHSNESEKLCNVKSEILKSLGFYSECIKK